MKQSACMLALSFALVGGLGASVAAFASEPLTCSLSVSPLKSDSSVKKSGGGNKGRGSSSTTTTFERNLKYKAVASFHGPAPEKPVLKVWYVGMGDGEMIEVGKAEHPLELNEKGRATVELVSPTTKMTKVKKTTQNGGRNSRGGGGTKSETTGERVTGCVIQVFAGTELMKSWASDSRWAKAAKNPSFAIELIDPKSGAKKK